MLRAAAWPRLAPPTAFVGLLGLNALLALGIGHFGWSVALFFGLLPIALVAFGALVAGHRAVLIYGALALGMVPSLLKDPLPLSASLAIFPADIVVILAVLSWGAARLMGGQGAARPGWPSSPVIGWPLLIFAIGVFWAVTRGHEQYDLAFVSHPTRLVLFAAIGFAIVGLDSKRLYKGIVAVFYWGTVWVFATAVYSVVSGTSQTGASSLSTGGTRVLALSVALYLACALFLALLNLEIDETARGRALHIAVACLALFGIILAYGRGTFAAVAVAVPLLVLGFRRVRRSLLSLLPLCLPFLALAAIFVPRAMPELAPTLINRVTPPTADQDLSVRWRQEANAAVWPQVEESPLIGVGFGRPASFTLEEVGRRFTIGQDPHNSYVFLLAGGGVFVLASFVLLLLTFAFDCWRRLRHAREGHERVLIIWSGFALFAFLVNALAEPLFNWPTVLLTIWTLMLLPSSVPVRNDPETA